MKRSNLLLIALAVSLSAVSLGAQAAGIDIGAWFGQHTDMASLSMVGAGTLEMVMKSLDKLEANLTTMSEKADGELKTLGKVSTETKTALDNLGVQQRELADRLTQIEQKGLARKEDAAAPETWGDQVVKSDRFADFASGQVNKLRVEVKNTLVGSDTNVAPDRKPGIVGGAFLPFSIERLLPSSPTTSNAVEFTKENVFTNAAAETAEGGQKPESSLTWTLVNSPIATVAHWIKISRQLAADNKALAAYVDTRMRYGVNQKVDTQLVVGNGTPPNISGMYISGNFTAHGYTNAALTAISATLKKLVLIRKIMADLYVAGYPADAIVLNPADWATIEIELFTTAAGQVLYNVNSAGQAFLFGLPVIQAIGMTAGNVLVGAFAQAYMVYNREGVVVDMSESDSDNFTKNLITLRAERRLQLATERPAAARGGLLVPA